MTEDKIEPREINWRQLLPWTVLFRSFGVAMGFSKLLLAAAGILVMATGWWLLAVAFFNATPKPTWPLSYTVADTDLDKAWGEFRESRNAWNLLLETAGPPDSEEKYEPADLADSRAEFEKIKELVGKAEQPDKDIDTAHLNALYDFMLEKKKVTPSQIKALAVQAKISETSAKAMVVRMPGLYKRAGVLRTWPWFEDRGPNPFLLVTGRSGIPWVSGHFADWLFTKQLPVLAEPLVKFLQPVLYFFSPRASLYTRFYFVLVMLWTLATWALFGGAITRMAAVEVARNEKIDPRDALRFVVKRYVSYATAPLLPLILVAGLVVVMIIYGLFHMIPIFGDIIVDGLLWGLMLALGVFMAAVLVGLISWPLMTATISAEDEEPLNAVARSYSYVIQAPWHYLWYSVVALLYGAVVIFFVGFMGSLGVYLAGWGVGQTPGSAYAGRQPTFLFVYAPTSFGWRTLLLEGATVGGQEVVEDGKIDLKPGSAYDRYLKEKMAWWNHAGAVLVAIWLGLFFLLILGVGYSYFWSASTIIYLLMRKQVDDAELDEVYFEEDEQEDYATAPPAAASKPASAPASPGLTMVEPPALRTPPAPAPVPPVPPPPAPAAPQVEEKTSSAAVATPPAPPRSEASSSDGGNGAAPKDDETPA